VFASTGITLTDPLFGTQPEHPFDQREINAVLVLILKLVHGTQGFGNPRVRVWGRWVGRPCEV
jgi:hypothetical protein